MMRCGVCDPVGVQKSKLSLSWLDKIFLRLPQEVY